MSKAEDYIRDNTKVLKESNGKAYFKWLTPDQARRAVEIAREEIYEWLQENAASFVSLADDNHTSIGDTKAFYGTKSLIHYLKQAMKDE